MSQNWTVWLSKGKIILLKSSEAWIVGIDESQIEFHSPTEFIIDKLYIFFLIFTPSCQKLIFYNALEPLFCVMYLDRHQAMDIGGVPVTRATLVSIGNDIYLLTKTTTRMLLQTKAERGHGFFWSWCILGETADASSPLMPTMRQSRRRWRWKRWVSFLLGTSSSAAGGSRWRFLGMQPSQNEDQDQFSRR